MRGRTIICILISGSALTFAIGEELKFDQVQRAKARARYYDVCETLQIDKPSDIAESQRTLRTMYGRPVHRAIEFTGEEMDAVIDPASGSIRSLKVKNRWSSSSAVKTPGMSRKDALAVVKRELPGLGIALDANLENPHGAFNASVGLWVFSWCRTVSGYPFPEEILLVSYDETQKRVISVRDLRTSEGCPTSPVIDSPEAVTLARSCLENYLLVAFGKDYTLGSLKNRQMIVVYPNAMYRTSAEEGASESTSLQSNATRPRLVYSFNADVRYVGASKLHRASPPLTLWVDALTGEVAGGF